MIQIRNVSEELHRKLRIRAAREGVTVSDLALGELRRAMAAPSPRELSARFSDRELSDYGSETAVESVRGERDER